jgi:hypothetical protein
MNEWMDKWFYTHTSLWNKNQHVLVINKWMDEWFYIHTYFSATQESTCIVPWMDEWMNEWMDGWSQHTYDLNTHTSVWHKNQHV